MIEPFMLAFVEPNDLDARQDWARQHAEWHQRIYTEAVKTGFQRYDTYPGLGDMEDLESWAYFHNREHENLTHSIFIGESPDLTGLEPQDKEAWDSWMTGHAKIHAEIRTALKII